MPFASLASDEIDFFTSLDAATSACVVVAPIRKDLLDTLIPERALIFFMFIRSEYAASQVSSLVKVSFLQLKKLLDLKPVSPLLLYWLLI